MTVGEYLWRVGVRRGLRRAQREFEARAPEIATLQRQTGLDRRRTFYVRFYMLDGRRGGDPAFPQPHEDFRVRVINGVPEIMPPGDEYDGHFAIDTVTAIALAEGRLRYPDKTFHEFDPMRAYMSGRVTGIRDFPEDRHIKLPDLLLASKAFPIVFEKFREERGVFRVLG